MPIVSEKQRQWLAENKPEVLKQMEAETPKDKPPETLGTRKSETTPGVRWH